MGTIGCYATGIFPRPKELIEVTRAYDRRMVDKEELERAFREATLKIVGSQVSANFSYITDGMLKWHDLLRPFTEKLDGVTVGGLIRWFNNNTFYRKPVIIGDLRRRGSVIEEVSYVKHMPRSVQWKVILPAPYTFAKLSENRFYKNGTELMFKYAQVLREEVRGLTELGFKYVQLSDPALVYNPMAKPIPRDELVEVREVLRVAVKGVAARTCLQTFFGDFAQILPEALDFPVDHLGIDMYETNIDAIKEYSFEKGIALGLVDARNSIIEDQAELVSIAREVIESVYGSKIHEVFICPNCDLEFLPWEIAESKIKVVAAAVEQLRGEFNG